MTCITFSALWFFSCNFVVTSGNVILHCDVQFWIIRVYQWLIHCQNARKECFSFPPPSLKMYCGSTAHVWHAGLHSACVEFTLQRHFSSLAVSEKVKHACWGYSHFCCSHWARHSVVFLEHGTNRLHTSLVAMADMPLWGASLHPPILHQQFHTMGMSAQPFIQESMTLVFSQEGSEASSQWKCWYVRNFHGLLFGWKWRSEKKQLHLAICEGQPCCPTMLCSIPYIGCQLTQP
jgi:hypothetical protein